MKKIVIIVLFAVMLVALTACIPVAPPSDTGSDVVITFSTEQGAFANGETSKKVKPDVNGKVAINDEPRLD